MAIKLQLSNVKWGRVLLAGLLVIAFTFLLLSVAIVIYSIILGAQAKGIPDQARIRQFSNQIGSWGGPLLTSLLTLLAAFWISRKTFESPQLHGWMLGLTVAVLGLVVTLVFGGSIDFIHAVWLLLTVVLGWLGSKLSTLWIKGNVNI